MEGRGEGSEQNWKNVREMRENRTISRYCQIILQGWRFFNRWEDVRKT